MIVSGAYGRDYTSAKAAKIAWESGADFYTRSFIGHPGGTYCSKRDFKSHEVIELRFSNDTNLTMVKGSSMHG